MTPDDVAIAEQISNEAFYDIDVRTSSALDPYPERRASPSSERWIERTHRFLRTDAAGCWVGEDENRVVGIATSIVRERLWVLVTFALLPGHQGRGIGKRLFEAARSAGPSCDIGLISSSDDPLALHRYHQAGFALHPQLLFRGEVDRSTLPRIDNVRQGTDDDLEWMDDLDRRRRGGPHGDDHASLRATARLIVDDSRTGYAYVTDHRCDLVAGGDEATASALLWECLAQSTGGFEVSHVTTANRWAIDIAMKSRLSMSQGGYLGVRGMEPPTSYIHNGALL